ncbi:MAG: hypothetical protein IJE05_02545 [Clostridia bacterium]|nr:hypothetical protein [Clostridia bacterium]
MFEITNNKVMLRGKLKDDFAFYEERDGKKFYKGTVAVKSLQRRYEDQIDVLINEEQLLERENAYKKIEIKGEIELNKDKCNVLAQKLHYLKEEYEPDLNFIFLEAYVIRKPWKKGQNVILAISLKSQQNSPYIKCVCSGNIAKRVSGIQVCKKVKLDGKIVSKRRKEGYINEVLVCQIEQ